MTFASGLAACPTTMDQDGRLAESLRSGDEGAFAVLIDRYHNAMLRLATVYVGDPAVAQDVVQDAWLGVLRGLDRFRARSSLKTWIFRIVIYTAKTTAARERRAIPLSALCDRSVDDSFVPAVAPERFLSSDAPRWPGHWASLPADWADAPDARVLSLETGRMIQAAVDGLSPSQRAVVSLRDSEGCSAAELCNILQISETNQRVLLHRGRSSVRRALEQYLSGS